MSGSFGYGEDSVKALARTKQREFIKRALPHFDPKKTCVFCLETSEGAEITQVYDTLGIPRSNITVAQPDPAQAEAIRERFGVYVRETMDLPFFQRTANQFRIISLDYTGQQTQETTEAIRTIACKHLLGDKGVLVTNFAGYRESKNMRRTLLQQFIEHVDQLPKEAQPETDFISYLEPGVRLDSELWEKVREAITVTTLKTLRQSKMNKKKPPITYSHPYVEATNKLILERAAAILAIPGYLTELEERQKEFGISREKTFEIVEQLRTNPEINPEIWILAQRQAATKFIAEQEKVVPSVASLLARGSVSRFGDGYHASAIERYRYTSNKGANMILDMFSLERPVKVWNTLDKILAVENRKIIVNPKGWTRAKLDRVFFEFYHGFKPLVDRRILPPQIYLGSAIPDRISIDDVITLTESSSLDEIMGSYRPLRKNLTREEGLALVDRGVTSADIERHFGTPVMRLAAWKAHRTMGTYEIANENR